MKKIIWTFIIKWIEDNHVGSNIPNSSQIVDGCLAIRDGLSNG
jgi:hypothetical protein